MKPILCGQFEWKRICAGFVLFVYMLCRWRSHYQEWKGVVITFNRLNLSTCMLLPIYVMARTGYILTDNILLSVKTTLAVFDLNNDVTETTVVIEHRHIFDRQYTRMTDRKICCLSQWEIIVGHWRFGIINI